MQTNPQDLFKMVSQDTGKSEQMYKDLGSFVFREASKMLKKPTSLIIKLKGVGSWHLRKRRMEIRVQEWSDKAVKPREYFSEEVFYNIYLDRLALCEIFKERLKDYEKYLEIKKKVREKRYETQVLLEPQQGEDEKFKSS